MTAHVMVPSIDSDRLASFSPSVVTDWLKARLGFGGVVFSDDLGMKAVSATTPLPEATVAALQAGCDVVLLCNSTMDEQWQAIEAVIRAAEAGQMTSSRIDDALARQRRMKERFASIAPGSSATLGHRGRRRTPRHCARDGGVAMTSTARSGLTRFRPVGPGSRVGLVAPASPFARADFEAGLRELARLDLVPVFDDRVFEREAIVAGSAALRAGMLREYLGATRYRRGAGRAWRIRAAPRRCRTSTPSACRAARTAFIGYSDVTALHTFLTCHVGLTTVHGPMIEGRLAVGETAYDRASLLASLSAAAVGRLAPAGLETLRPGEVDRAVVRRHADAADGVHGHAVPVRSAGRPRAAARRSRRAAVPDSTHADAARPGRCPGAGVGGRRAASCRDATSPAAASRRCSVLADLLRDFPGPVIVRVSDRPHDDAVGVGAARRGRARRCARRGGPGVRRSGGIGLTGSEVFPWRASTSSASAARRWRRWPRC